MPLRSTVAIFSASSALDAVPAKATGCSFQTAREWSLAPK